MSTYGIDESKSRVEVFPATQVYKKSEVYNKNETYAKAEVYNRTEADATFLTQVAGAPKNHASSANTYGLGTSTNYGHVKLTTSTAVPSGDQNGIALAGSMGYTLNKKIDDMAAAMPFIPFQGIVVLGAYFAPEEVAQMMGYGTWAYNGHITVSDSTGSHSAYLYMRRDR